MSGKPLEPLKTGITSFGDEGILITDEMANKEHFLTNQYCLSRILLLVINQANNSPQ